MLFRITGKSGSDELEILSFIMKTEEMNRTKIKILKFLESNDIRYINKESPQENSLYILVNIGKNYFFSYEFINKKLTELVVPNEVGVSPALYRLTKNLIIFIGGSSSRTVNIFDTHINKWSYIGDMNSIRIGAYAILNSEYNVVYICGGKNEDGDNSLEIEYFKLIYEENSAVAVTSNDLTPTDSGESESSKINDKDNLLSLSSSFYPTEIKTKTPIKNDFLLRKSNPVIVPLLHGNSYLICGGDNIFGPTKSCVLYDSTKDLICLANSELPKFTSDSNQMAVQYKSSNFYFYSSDNAVISYSYLDGLFELIETDIVDV
jgi:hypothetical protein